MNQSTMELVSDQDLEAVEGGCVFVIALAVFALELHIWDMITE